MTWRPIPLTSALVLAVLAAPASGYEIAKTANEAQHELHWDRTVIPFQLEIYGWEGPDPADLRQALLAAFRSWGEVERSAVQFWHDLTEAVAESEPDGSNVLYWTMEDWPHDPLVIALTSINYYPDTGLIADADIDFNGVEFVWTTSLETPRVDVQSIATHEIGHVVGIDHSGNSDAVMWWEYVIYPNGMGETRQRTLHDDDREAIAYLYPCQERWFAVDDWVVTAHADNLCDEPFFTYPEYEGDPHTASCSTGAGRSLMAAWLVAVLAAAVAVARRRSRLPLLVLILLGIVAAGEPASRAHVCAHLGFDVLAGQASSAAVAQVIAVEPFEAGGKVHSLVTLHVEQWLDGEGSDILLLERPSGELPHLGTYVPGDPRFREGQELLLFLGERSDGTPGLLGMQRGFFEIAAADGRRFVRSPGGRPAGAETWVPLESVIDEYLSARQDHLHH